MKTVSKSKNGFTVTLQNPYKDLTVKELLEEKLHIPRKTRHWLRTKKHVLVNGERINWQSLVKKGDQIDLSFDDEDYPNKTIIMGQADQVDCLYDDDHLIIVNKPEGMKTHGNEPTELALLNHVSAYAGRTCYVVHRLDMETSGVILFAKTPFILPILNHLLEKREIRRDYWALVQGTFSAKEMIYRDPIGRHRHDRRQRTVDPKNGQRALTRVKPLKQFGERACLVNCCLETGRTHQIRVHLAHHGHPLLGDPLYAKGKKECSRLMLHAHQLQFVHPLTQQTICIKATSDSFEKALNQIKAKGQ
ncbi:RluA family pseudouridine synthase [Streptococcus castoreus]|uniref:RluA family pseudouridine synthase n=1 Tax=Streptococcus castoreus TaxID=254786 RepID=UPI00040C8E27|nr:RluA family pseudouridine synthase [Streptococcus castoreus]